MCSEKAKGSDDLASQQASLQSRLYKTNQYREEFLIAYTALMATWQVDYESRFVSTDFGETYVVEVNPPGSGPQDSKPLVLIPGGQGTAGMWGPVMPALSVRRRVLSLDLIDQVGHSRPTRVLENPEEAAVWVAQTLDGLGLGQVNLMGNSIGSFIAAQFALTHPTRVQNLVLTAPAATFARVRAGYIFRVLLTLMSPLKRSKRRFIEFNGNRRGDLEDPFNKLQLVAMSGTRVISKLTPAAFSDTDIQSWAVKTLAIFGECDGVNTIGSAETVAKLKQVNSRIKTEMIANAGHSFTPDDFRHCAKLADAFLREH